MPAKAATASALMGRVKSKWTPPPPMKDASLLMQGLLCVLTRNLTPTQSESTIKNLQAGFFDWNEVRIAQAQEIIPHIASRAKNGGSLLIARDIKTYLQEVFQQNHGFDLEFLSEDEGAAGKFIAELEFLGAEAGHYLLWIANGEALPVSLDLIRVFDRLGLIGRTSSVKKGRAAIEPLVPKGNELEFVTSFGQVIEKWCTRTKPVCWECPLVDDCPHGKKVFKDWKQQQERLATQRKREAERELALAKKEDARRRRESERLTKKLKQEREKAERAREAEEKRKAKELAKKEAEKQKKLEAKAAERSEARKKVAAEKAAIVKKKKEAQKAAAAKKKAAEVAKKKAAAEKAAAAKKKAADKKAAAAKKKAAKKTSSKKKTASKKTASKKTVSKKTVSKKTTSKKKPAKKATKKTAKKKTTKKSSAKPPKKKVTKKPAKKVTKKTATRKPTRKKR